MSAKPEASEEGAAPAKSKKMLIIIVAAVLVVALGGGGVFFMMKKKAAADDEEGADAAPAKTAAHDKHKLPPVYLPMDNMVVNLANPGGERVAQVGVTLEVVDAEASTQVKAYMPTIRSGVLMLISKHTAEELLTAEGKEKLAQDILRETSLPFGGGEEDEAPAKGSKKKKVVVQYPVIGVHFSSFIVQ
ncbi:flagellar basal body-associated FliL family protein [Curvibacter sp. APW13]|uniref:flagellar basal body-associated FliL family protein n=1 Tax=Curvibacter sp. APW13 TaxID=3077236 RepID=UPI0028DD5D01|nr:flagellar basal body-associated FliL family protein [Curvibacter sp. APW13]MDT8992908.1 flagellar basal body-associated FliL family protein [Curvibacter sp. APW13]